MSKVLNTTTPRARRPRTCDYCFTTIVRGERYKYEVIVGDDGLYAWSTCRPCVTIRPAVWRWSYADDGIGPEEFDEWALLHESDPEHGEAARGYLARRATASTARTEKA